MTRKQGILALAGAWLLPLAAHAAGADLLLPPVILVALMAVQRGSATLLDRFVVALGQLVGATCAAGLVISAWPWRMHPVFVAGFALSVLAVLGWLRGPSWPRWGDRRDALVVAGWLGATSLAAVPLVVRDLGARLGVVAPGEDLARHFVLYDVIGQLGGYAFMHLDEAHRRTSDDGMLTYPQGTHFLYALLGRFAHSGADGVSSMSWLIWCLLGTYSFLVLAVLWAARRVAGPGVSPLALLLVLLPVSAYLVFGDLLAVLFRGFPNELLGLALAALLVGVLARPLHRLGEQVATVVALLVGISFAYYLFLPFACLAVGLWVLSRWRYSIGGLRLRKARSGGRPRYPIGGLRLRKARSGGRRWWLVAFAVVTAPLLLVTPLAIPQANNGGQLLLKGTAIAVDRPVTVAVVIAAIAGLLVRRGLRSPSARTVAGCLALALLTVGALGVYQYAAVGHTVYYFEKVLHLLLTVALVATGALVRLVPVLSTPRRLAPALAGALVICAGVAGLGGPTHTKLGSYGLHVVLGVEKGTPDGGRDAVLVAHDYPDPNGPIVVDLRSSPYGNFFGTMYGSAMRRDYGAGLVWMALLYPPSGPKTVADVERLVETSPRPVRLLVSDPAAHSIAGPGGPSNPEIARALAAKYPGKVLIG